jgi:hypothetical protein
MAKLTKAKNINRTPLRSLATIAHEYAHTSNNVETDYHSYDFEENFSKILIELIETYDEYLDQSSFNKVYTSSEKILMDRIKTLVSEGSIMTTTDILSHKVITEILEIGGEPDVALNNLLEELTKHSFINESKLDNENIVVIKRKDLLF